MKEERSTGLALCRRMIEEKSGLGHSEGWTTLQFEQLSGQIEQATGVLLSVTTLKRLWGRVQYQSAPNNTTLNVLAKFTGYPTWTEFETSFQQSSGESNIAEQIIRATDVQSPARTTSRSNWKWTALVIALTLMVTVFIFSRSVLRLNPAHYSFSSRRVSIGIPNSVLFHYNATAAPTDSVYIQQSWDIRRRELVPRTGHEHMSIYYYPGHFRAKLVVGNEVVSEHDVYIPSDDWVVAVKEEPVPVYFERKETIKNGTLHLPVETMVGQQIQMQPRLPQVRYRHVPDLKGLKNDNFLFETRIRNDYMKGSGACQKLAIVILCENDAFYIPLSAPGCVGDLYLYMAGDSAVSKTNDLSAFGCNLSEWVDFKCEVKNGIAKLYINGKEAYAARLPNNPAKLVGISYEFEGTGSVDYTRFSHTNGEVVFEDEFD